MLVTPKELPPTANLERKKSSLLSEVLYLLGKVMIIGALLLLVITFLFGANRNTDQGMALAVKNGDLVCYFRLDKQYAASDLVALKADGDFQIRRVVAVGGDTVDLTEEGLLVNGYVQQEIDTIGETLAYSEGISFPVTLAADEVFLLGDNREQAADSRLYGAVNTADTLGQVVLLLRRRNL